MITIKLTVQNNSIKSSFLNLIQEVDYRYNDKTIVFKDSYNADNLSELSDIINYLHYYDSVEIFVDNALVITIQHEPALMCKYKVDPFLHQKQAILYGLDDSHNSWLLLDSPGAGKTAEIIHIAEELKAQKGLEHCLIVCAINSLKANWEAEIKKHSDLSCRVLGKKINSKGTVSYASIKERANELMHPIDAFFIITNIESLRSDEVVDALKKTPNKIDMMCIDEVHKASNSRSEQGSAIQKLTNYKYKIAMTGTLLTNSPLSAYLPLKWIGVEKSNLTNFKGQYCVFGGFGGHQIVGYKNLDILKDELDSCSLRRTKDQFMNKEKMVIREYVELDDKHKAFYENVKDAVIESCDKVDLKPGNVMSLVTRLRQATSCPSLLTTENIPASKLDRAEELVEEITSQGDKVVIMSMFKEPLSVLYNRLKELNPILYTGDFGADDDWVKFQNDQKYKVFLTTFSKGGTGLTLNAASYSILIDTPWTYALTEQGEDRIFRANNANNATIYHLVAKDTIDEMVDEIVTTKKAISDYLIDGIADEATVNVLRKYIQELN